MMEELSLYFEPVSLHDVDFFPVKERAHRIGDRLHIFTEEEAFPELDSIRIALFGVAEERKAYQNTGCSLGANEIRKQLYALYGFKEMPEVADLGNLRCGKTVEDTYRIVQEVCAALISQQTIPVILGGSQDLTYANYLAYEQLQEVINITSVDTRFDIGNKLGEDASNAYFHKIILRKPNYLFNYTNLGYQSYFVDPDDVALMQKLKFDAYRFGKLHEELFFCEPILRDTTLLSIDMAAVRFSDAPGCRHTSPNGFNGQEICALCRFAGASNRLSSLGIYEYNPTFDIADQSAKLIAEMLWYFMEGFSLRQNDQPDLMKEDYIKYIVGIQEGLYQVIFYENKTSHRWWMEVPCTHKKSRYEQMYLIPCSPKDYEAACRNELPERWLANFQKLEENS
ncbi:MAG: formimidoylglutamase, partial [Bacteroidales bacterium]|nr:formimidoylglutamase [Bacteroidales bacterium]